MGLVQCFVVILMSSAQLVLNFPLAELGQYYTMNGRTCKMCPAGEYQESCTECKPCPTGSYTTGWNREDRCDRCSGDCRADFNLKVVQNCTSKSDLKCICEAGFTCVDMVPYSTNCRYCEKIQEATTLAEAAALISDNNKLTSSASPGHSSTSSKPCRFLECGPQTVGAVGNATLSQTERINNQLAAILACLVFAIGCAALMILFYIRQPQDNSCFKQAIAVLVCNKGGKDASHKSKETTHQFPRDSFRAKQQASSLSAANLGPVHVHNPGTVIFSLLSQFTGQTLTTEGGNTAERGSDEDESDCPEFHPTSSPSIHFSEEEMSRETDSIFFPSQEQGKDCHVSKEEVL